LKHFHRNYRLQQERILITNPDPLFIFMLMAICRVKIFQLNTLIFREMEHIIWNSEISAELRADRAYFTFPLFV